MSVINRCFDVAAYRFLCDSFLEVSCMQDCCLQPLEADSLMHSGLPRSGKISGKMNFFPGQGKVWEFCEWPGKFSKDLESRGNDREFEKKTGYGRKSSENLFILFKRGKDVHSHQIIYAQIPPHWGLL